MCLPLSEMFQQSLCLVWVNQWMLRNCFETVLTLKKCFFGESAVGATWKLAGAQTLVLRHPWQTQSSYF